MTEAGQVDLIHLKNIKWTLWSKKFSLSIYIYFGTQGGDEAAGGLEVPDLAAIKARVREMEEEAEKLKQMQTEVDKQIMGSPPGLSESCAIQYTDYNVL